MCDSQPAAPARVVMSINLMSVNGLNTRRVVFTVPLRKARSVWVAARPGVLCWGRGVLDGVRADSEMHGPFRTAAPIVFVDSARH